MHKYLLLVLTHTCGGTGTRACYRLAVIFREKLSRLIGDSSRAKISRAAGVPATVVTTYVNRGSEPSATNALKLARALGVPVDWLIDDDQDWPPPTHDRTAEVSLGSAADDELRSEFVKRYRAFAVSFYNNLKRAESIDWKGVAAQVEKLKDDAKLPEKLQEHERLARLLESTFHLSQSLSFDPGRHSASYIQPHPAIPDDALWESNLRKRYIAIEEKLTTLLRALHRRKSSSSRTVK